MRKRYSSDKILLNSQFFEKKAGMLAFPPKMKQEIMATADNIFKTYQNSKFTGPYNDFVEVDLTELPKSYRAEILTKLVRSIPVTYYIKDANEAEISGQWSPSRYAFVFTLIIYDGIFDRNNFEDTVEHELSHMVQTFIHNTIELKQKVLSRRDRRKEKKRLESGEPEKYVDNRFKSRPGFPSQWDVKTTDESETDKYQEFGTHYYTSGIEFFPQLKNQISAFMRSGSKNKYDFMKFVYSNPFMVDLRLNKPKMYKRAVTEAWKIIQDNLDTDPKKEAESKKKFDSWKFISDNKLEIIDFADRRGFEKIIPIAATPKVIQNGVKNLLKMFQISTNENRESSRFDFNKVTAVIFTEDKKNNSIYFSCIIQNSVLELIALRRPAPVNK